MLFIEYYIRFLHASIRLFGCLEHTVLLIHAKRKGRADMEYFMLTKIVFTTCRIYFTAKFCLRLFLIFHLSSWIRWWVLLPTERHTWCWFACRTVEPSCPHAVLLNGTDPAQRRVAAWHHGPLPDWAQEVSWSVVLNLAVIDALWLEDVLSLSSRSGVTCSVLICIRCSVAQENVCPFTSTSCHALFFLFLRPPALVLSNSCDCVALLWHI